MTDPAAPRPAATLVLIRDGGTGLEVLMITRHQASSFAAGALVFPGGRVEEDEDGMLREHCRGLDGLDEAEARHRVAALRETFEESGVLLAARRGEADLLSRGKLEELRARHAPAAAGGPALAALLRTEGLELAGDLLDRFGHWITPTDRPKRFDTRFYVAPMPCDQTPVYDGREAVDAVWVSPSRALEEADAGRVSLVFATRVNLARLASFRTAAEVIEDARRHPIVPITPEIVETPGGTMFRIPPGLGYGVTEVPGSILKRA
jgi:8-oxo-dGTP pyrophosphatase MutT (NUDIX family)